MRSHTCPIRLCRHCVLLLSLALGFGLEAADQPPARPFSIHDTNGDGYLSPQEYAALLELRRAHHRLRYPTGAEPAPSFEELDRDGNGLIDETELTDMLQQRVHRRHGPRWRYPRGGG